MIRAVGFSENKVKAVRDLAAKTLAGIVPTTRKLNMHDDEEIIERLTQVRGIGRWTVEMLLIFQLGRPMSCPSMTLAYATGCVAARCRRDMTPKLLRSYGETLGRRIDRPQRGICGARPRCSIPKKIIPKQQSPRG